MEVRVGLEALGFFAIARGIDELRRAAESSATGAGSHPNFQLFPSFIPAESVASQQGTVVLIDIGGTATKVATRRVDPGRPPVWRVLFEEPNDAFFEDQDPALRAFATAIAQRCRCSAPEVLPLGISIGIVWSNAMSNRVVAGAGIHGVIAGREQYTKGEWFNRNTKNGDDISAAFVGSFRQCGFSVNRSIVANDTPLTMKALPGADAGMVASTGVNATIVDDSDGRSVICNAEMGTSFRVAAELLSAGDLIGLNQRASVVEHLIAGKFLPAIFAGQILALVDAGYTPLREIAEGLRGSDGGGFESFETEDLTHCITDPERFLERRETPKLYAASIRDDLKIVATAIVERSARLAAVLAYASIYRQLARRERFVIALDSRLAREIPLFWTTMREQLSQLMPAGKAAHLTLVDRMPVDGGVLSVPMLGAAHALDCLC